MKRPFAGFVIALLVAGFAVRCAKPSATVSGLTVSGTAAFSHRGVTSQLTATAALSSGAPNDVTTDTTWSSGDTTIAVVSNTGLLTTIGNGTVTITGTYQGKTGTLVVVVTLKADPQVSSYLERRCSPKRAAIAIRITEASGDVGMTINEISVSFVLFGSSKAFHSFSAPEIGGHLAPGQTRFLTFESAYPGGIETEDSNAIISGSVVDDLGHSFTISRNDTFGHDGC